MDALQRQSREVQIVLGAGVVYLIMSFLDWQQVEIGGFKGGANLWHGVGVVAGLLVVALLVWETMRLLQVKIELGGTLTPGLVSAGLAGLLLLFTIIAFLDKNEFRHWPAWIGLIASIAIAAAAWMRAKAEGLQMPELGSRPSSPGPGAGPPAE